MGVYAVKKKLSSANRRVRDRSLSRLSFFFVIFFFGLFSLIIIMENLADGNKHMLKDEEVEGDAEETENYSNWDISYEEVPHGYTPNANYLKTQTTPQLPRKVVPVTSQARTETVVPDWQKVAGAKEKFFVYSAYFNSLLQ